MPDTTNINGGVNITGNASAGGDIVGRDKIVQAPDPLAQYFHQLPPAPSDFVGRDEEQRDLLNMIERGALITGLRGLGGIGKTALGLIIAHHLKARYAEAQFFLDLRGAGDNPVTPLEALTHVVRAFYPTSKLPDSLEEMQKLYRSVLEGKRALVFFDNAKDAQQVIPLLPPASCLLLITSREHFALPGLKAKDLNVLPPDKARELLIGIADRLADVILSAESAKDLFAHQPEIPRPYGTRNDTVWVADLMAQLCGYLPQALRASASLLAETIDLDPIEYVRQLSDERQRLQRIGLDPARNLDMEASLNLSYKALSAEAQRVLARLSVFPRDFDAEAEEVICKDEGHAHLSRLVKLSLVQYTPPLAERPPASQRENAIPLSPAGRGAGGEGRYSLHDLVHIFADGHLTDDERAAAQLGHARQYERVLRQAKELYKQGNEFIAQGLALFDREWINIQAGQQWASNTVGADSRSAPSEVSELMSARANTQVLPDIDEAAQSCSDYPDAGAFVLDLRLHAREHIRWLESGLNAAQQLHDREMAGIHSGYLGLKYFELGEVRKATGYYEEALRIARETKDRYNEGAHLGNLGIAYAALGDARKAIEFYEQALVIARDIGDKRSEGADLGNLGIAYKNLGDARKAIEFHEQALVIDREIGDRRGEGADLGNLGLAYKNLGDVNKAIEFYEQQLAIACEIGDRRGEGNALGNLGLAYKNLGDANKAIEFYEQALIIDREIGDQRGEGADLGNLGNAYADLGDARRAIEFYEQILDIHRAIGDRRGEGAALFNIALSLDSLGEREKAIANAEAALKIFEAIEDPRAEKVRKTLAGWKE